MAAASSTPGAMALPSFKYVLLTSFTYVTIYNIINALNIIVNRKFTLNANIAGMRSQQAGQ